MKLSSIKFLLFFIQHLILVSIIVGAAKVRNDDENGSVILDGFNNGTVGHFNHELFGVEHRLMAEEKNDAAAEDVNKNVHFVKPGKVNLTLKYNDQLTFQVCSNCTGYVHICYESSDRDGNLKGDCRESSQCSLQIYGQQDNRNEPASLYFGPVRAAYPKPAGAAVCDTIKITGTPSEFKEVAIIKTCKPKIENGMIQLEIIKADGDSCSVQAINANVKLPEIIATPSPPQTSVKPIKSTETSNSGTSESSFPWWVILIICVVLLAVGIGIGIAVYFWCKKCRSSKVSPTEVTSQPPLVVVTGNDPNKEPTVTKTPIAAPAAVASNDTPSSKRKTDLNFTKFEPSVQSKKGKKKTKKATTTQEPTTTEDVPPPHSVSKQPVLAQTVPTVIGKAPRLVPRAMKSVKTDSLDMTLKKDKMEMIESVIDSVKRNCLQSLDSEMVQEMKDKYPEMQHHVRVAEIELLCVPIGKMLDGINALAHECKQKLISDGCKFDAKSRLTSVSGVARSLLQKQKTPASTVYFAFGAQYHRLISDKDLGSYSIPLLMVFALQIRFPEKSRRKACAMIRRKIPIILGSFSEASRRKMPFPLNIIEDAYCRDPIMFRHLSDIQTDSEEYRKKKQLKEGSY